MSFTVIFYVHHHGSGHLMRTLQIVDQLVDYQVILMGSGLQKIKHFFENVSCLHLPEDIPEVNEQPLAMAETTLGLHYAPLGLKGIRDRGLMMTEALQRNFPAILVVDVSVEVTLLARLLGIPTIVIRQHGKRDDLPHRLAYQSAELVIAPFCEPMYTGDRDDVYSKTLFTGGFSRFDDIAMHAEEDENAIAILVGQGGTSLSAEIVEHIATCCTSYHFDILGEISGENLSMQNITFHGRTSDPTYWLSRASMIIGNTGHNTVMEAASLNKRFIGIPEARPFDEQVDKANAIGNREGIAIILPANLLSADWSAVVHTLASEQADWNGVINPAGPSLFAEAIISTAKKLFENP